MNLADRKKVIPMETYVFFNGRGPGRVQGDFDLVFLVRFVFG